MRLETRWRRVVGHYTKLLRLSGWQIYTYVGHTDKGVAEVILTPGLEFATVRLAEGWKPLKRPLVVDKTITIPLTLDELACHEVLHILLREVGESLVELGNDFDGEAVTNILSSQLEIGIDRLAQVISGLSPSGLDLKEV